MTRAEIENLVLGIYRGTETGDVSILDDVAPLSPTRRR